MSGTMCQLEIIGNLGRDPEMRYTASGQPVTNFSVAATRTYLRGEEKVDETTWVRVSTWGKQAEACNMYLKKGSKVRVVGRLVVDANGGPKIFTKQDGSPAASFEVNASDVMFLSKRESGDEMSDNSADEIPF